MGQIQSLAEFYSLIRRNLLLIATVFILGTLLAAVYAKTRPDIYESTAVIQIETSEVSTPAQGAAGGNEVGLLMETIERRLTTRDALLDLATRHGVLAGEPLSDDEKVAVLRESTRVQTLYCLAPQGGG